MKSEIKTNPELPPHGVKEKQRLQTIRQSGKIIGYLDIYHGYPEKDIFWLGDLFLRFWARVGFSKIVGYLGDKEYGSNKFADLILEMNIQEYLNSNSINL